MEQKQGENGKVGTHKAEASHHLRVPSQATGAPLALRWAEAGCRRRTEMGTKQGASLSGFSSLESCGVTIAASVFL